MSSLHEAEQQSGWLKGLMVGFAIQFMVNLVAWPVTLYLSWSANKQSSAAVDRSNGAIVEIQDWFRIDSRNMLDEVRDDIEAMRCTQEKEIE